MTYPVTLATLRARAQQRSAMPASSQFIATAEWNDLIQQAVCKWYDLVVGTTWGGATYWKTFNFATAANQSAYPMPGDWLHIDSVDVFVAPGTQSNQVISARPYQSEMRNAFRFWNVTWNYAYPVFYRVQGQTLNFIPTPPGSFTVGLNYVPTAPQLVQDTDNLDSINGWDELIVLWVAEKVFTKEENWDGVAAIRAQIQEEIARIQAAAGTRDRNAAEVVHDVTNDTDPYQY